MQKKLKMLQDNLKSIETMVDDPTDESGKTEPLARYSLLPILKDVMAIQQELIERIEAGVVSSAGADDDEGDEDGNEDVKNVAVLSAPIVARILFTLWSNPNNPEWAEFARNMTMMLTDQPIDLPLVVYDEIERFITRNGQDKNVQNLALLLYAEKNGKTEEEVLAEIQQMQQVKQ